MTLMGNRRLDNKLRILHVDDDVVMGMEIKDLLEGEGYEVCDTVCSGSEAIQSVRSHKPHVVLMDVKLKGEMKKDDYEAAARAFLGNFLVDATAGEKKLLDIWMDVYQKQIEKEIAA